VRVAAAGGIDPHEGPERSREVGFGHAFAMIAHAQAVMPVTTRRRDAKRRRAVGEGVLHEVGEYPVQFDSRQAEVVARLQLEYEERVACEHVVAVHIDIRFSFRVVRTAERIH